MAQSYRALSVAVVLGLMAAAGAWAQENPAAEPRMIDIPDSQNPAVMAGNELMRGKASMKSAAKALAKAETAEEKKRAKLEAKAQRAYEEAAEHFLAAVQQDSELIEGFVGLGQAWHATGESEKALQAWGAAYQKAPENADVLVGLGQCFLALERAKDVASVYVNLVKIDAPRANELLAQLRELGEQQVAAGTEGGQELLDWIDQQG